MTAVHACRAVLRVKPGPRNPVARGMRYAVSRCVSHASLEDIAAVPDSIEIKVEGPLRLLAAALHA
jgi:hypothetical protein